MSRNFNLNYLNELQLNHRVFYLFDSNTIEFCLPKLPITIDPTNILVIPSGEAHKRFDTYEYVCLELVKKEAQKDCILVNVGGGVVSDLGGFVAATFKRGIDYYNVPTSLLGMVDASIGGKTGVDVNHVKNAVGCTYLPKGILLDACFLDTLPKRHVYNGYAEVIKTFAIDSLKTFNTLQVQLPALEDKKEWNQVIEKCADIKSGITVADPFEKNIRKILNFGHTIGHAIESFALSSGIDLLHGEAIAAGMLIESYAGEKQNVVNSKFVKLLAEQIQHNFQKLKFGFDYAQLQPYLIQDKKNINGEIKFALLADFGKPLLNENLNSASIIEAIERYQS